MRKGPISSLERSFLFYNLGFAQTIPFLQADISDHVLSSVSAANQSSGIDNEGPCFSLPSGSGEPHEDVNGIEPIIKEGTCLDRCQLSAHDRPSPRGQSC